MKHLLFRETFVLYGPRWADIDRMKVHQRTNSMFSVLTDTQGNI